MTRVVDASVVVAALVDAGAEGEWSAAVLAEGEVVAPHLMPAEVANVLRRSAIRGALEPSIATLAHEDLLELPVTLLPFVPFAPRVWELRHALTSYDAWYVAVAEELQVELATLDARLARAPGPICTFLTAPE